MGAEKGATNGGEIKDTVGGDVVTAEDRGKAKGTVQLSSDTGENGGSSDSGATLDTFHPFPRLPVEIRLKIWKNALPGRRVVEIDFDRVAGWYPAREATPEPSSLLRVCKESREEFQRVYSAQIPRKTLYRWKSYSITPVCYLDPNFDVLYVKGPEPGNSDEPGELAFFISREPMAKVAQILVGRVWFFPVLFYIFPKVQVAFIFGPESSQHSTPTEIIEMDVGVPEKELREIRKPVMTHFPQLSLAEKVGKKTISREKFAEWFRSNEE